MKIIEVAPPRPDVTLSTGLIVRHVRSAVDPDVVETRCEPAREMTALEWEEYADRTLGHWPVVISILKMAKARGYTSTRIVRGRKDWLPRLAARGLLQDAGGGRYEITLAGLAAIAAQ